MYVCVYYMCIYLFIYNSWYNALSCSMCTLCQTVTYIILCQKQRWDIINST